MIRLARPDDIAFIKSLIDAPQNLDKLEGYDMATLRAALDDGGSTVLIWQPANQPEGFAWLRNTAQGTKLEELAMARPGGGMGAAFLAAIRGWLAGRGATRFWLNVAADNDGAIRFYQRAGFRRGKVTSAVWQRRRGPVADALCMDIDLPDAPAPQGGLAW